MKQYPIQTINPTSIFLSKSPWDEDQATDQIAHDADDIIGGDQDTCLLIDESSFPKKGNKSAGVSRPYCGELGNTDVVEILSYYLPNRKATEEEVFRQLEVRHKRRNSAIESAFKSQLT